MQMNNVNIVVFDQDESSYTEQSRINYSNVRRANINDPYASNQTQPVIINQITALNQKVCTLQQKAQKIQQYIKNSNINSNNSELNTSSNNNSITSSQIQELLRIVQFKIQVIVNQTKKIMDRMTSEFDKKISKTTAQKNHQMNSISKIQAHCRDTITKVQQNYQQQLNILRSQHVHLQKRLIHKIEQIQGDYRAKLQDFRNKQQEYVVTIQNLQNKLRVMSMSINNNANVNVKNANPPPNVNFNTNPNQNNAHFYVNSTGNTSLNSVNSVNSGNNNINMNKNKKILQVTQQRPLSSLKSQSSDILSYTSSQQTGTAHQNLNDTSNRRRTKIFEGRNSGKSISPNPNNNQKTTSPLKPQQNIKNEPKVTIKYQNPQGYKPPAVIEPTNNFISQAKQAYHNITVKATVIPENKVQQPPQGRSQTERYQRAQQENNVKQLSKRQTTSPKPFQWEKFQDFNDQDDSGQSEDVFFYPDHEQGHEPKSVFDYDQNNDSMHSPFDIK